jgi:hypothetical protein
MVGSIPLEIVQLRVLRVLHLSSNKLTGSCSLQRYDLSDYLHNDIFDYKCVMIIGIIPVELGQLRHLRNLRLSQNELAGNHHQLMSPSVAIIIN